DASYKRRWQRQGLVLLPSPSFPFPIRCSQEARSRAPPASTRIRQQTLYWPKRDLPEWVDPAARLRRCPGRTRHSETCPRRRKATARWPATASFATRSSRQRAPRPRAYWTRRSAGSKSGLAGAQLMGSLRQQIPHPCNLPASCFGNASGTQLLRQDVESIGLDLEVRAERRGPVQRQSLAEHILRRIKLGQGLHENRHVAVDTPFAALCPIYGGKGLREIEISLQRTIQPSLHDLMQVDTLVETAELGGRAPVDLGNAQSGGKLKLGHPQASTGQAVETCGSVLELDGRVTYVIANSDVAADGGLGIRSSQPRQLGKM